MPWPSVSTMPFPHVRSRAQDGAGFKMRRVFLERLRCQGEAGRTSYLTQPCRACRTYHRLRCAGLSVRAHVAQVLRGTGAQHQLLHPVSGPRGHNPLPDETLSLNSYGWRWIFVSSFVDIVAFYVCVFRRTLRSRQEGSGNLSIFRSPSPSPYVPCNSLLTLACSADRAGLVVVAPRVLCRSIRPW
jgi:hypothetical protein